MVLFQSSLPCFAHYCVSEFREILLFTRWRMPHALFVNSSGLKWCQSSGTMGSQVFERSMGPLSGKPTDMHFHRAVGSFENPPPPNSQVTDFTKPWLLANKNASF